MTRNWVGLLLLMTISAACSPTTESIIATSSASPIPSVSSPTPSTTPDVPTTLAPLTAATPAIVIESSQIPPTPTLLNPVVPLPTEQLKIFYPGPASQVTNPFQVAGWGGPSYRDRVKLRLLGENGRVLTEGNAWLHVLPEVENSGRFYLEFPFDISLVAEAARLEASMYGYRDGQLSHLNTVNLTLLSVGSSLIHPAINGPEKLAIFYPRQEAVIEGGQVTVYGAGWVDSDLPLTVEVLDNNGEVLGSSQVYLDAPVIGQLGTFQVDIPYQITFPQWARIGVSEYSTDIPGLIHYSSVEVWLKP